MNTFTLVRPEHLNHHGFLFGGQLLKWVDEFAWLVAALDFPRQMLVTRAMDNIEFKTTIHNGSILRFEVLPRRKGKSSITYSVKVFAGRPGRTGEEHVFSNNITFVCIDARGRKKTLPVKSRLRSESESNNGGC
jgi:acyl-CoA hydrolase